MRRKKKGFSLIELMIAVAIVAILAAIAYPSFMQQVRETRRTEAVVLTTKIMQAQERYFINNFTYTTDLTDLGFASSVDLPSENGHYLINAEACAGSIATCVNIVSTAQGSQRLDGDIEYNSRGESVGHWNP